MSEFAQKVKQYYDMGLWDIARVRKAVAANKITPEEFKAITGSEY